MAVCLLNLSTVRYDDTYKYGKIRVRTQLLLLTHGTSPQAKRIVLTLITVIFDGYFLLICC